MKNVIKKLDTKVSKISPIFLFVIALAGASVGYLAITSTQADNKYQSSARCEGVCVYIRDEGMVPSELAVKTGEFVQFNSADGEKHNLAEGKGGDGHDMQDDSSKHGHVGDFSSGDFEADEAWRVQFKKAGTYRFHDHYNPNQNIVVVVYDADTSKDTVYTNH